MKKSFFYNLPTIGILLFILLFLVNPSYYSSCAIKGLKIFTLNVLPCLLPFFIATKLLIKIGNLKNIGKFFYPITKFFCKENQGGIIFFISLLSGFPIGVATATELYFDKQITKESCINLSLLCNLPGPIFVLGTVASFWQSKEIALILYISTILGTLTNAFLFSKKNKAKTKHELNFNVTKQKDEISNFSQIISNSITNVLFVGATIMLFGIISNMILSILPPLHPIANTIIHGIIEVTNGCQLASSLENKYLGVILSAGFLGFSGLCVFLQTSAFWSKVKLSPLPFLIKKATQGVASMIYCALFILIFNINL